MKQGWKKYFLYTGIIIGTVAFSYIIIQTVKAKNTGFETKSLWEWMELLLIPLVLTLGAIGLNWSERATEREIAINRQREDALQTYLDRMTDLLIKENLQSTKKKSVRDVARVRTLTVLRGLDVRRKEIVLLFLQEADLIDKGKSIVNLSGAELLYIDLSNTAWSGTNLSGANLSNANLSDASLSGINLSDANLNSTKLSYTDLRIADLRGADLSGVDLSNADLSNADLRCANLRGTNLSNSNLSHADLRFAKVSKEQLETAKALEGTIMPDGTKHT